MQQMLTVMKMRKTARMTARDTIQGAVVRMTAKATIHGDVLGVKDSGIKTTFSFSWPSRVFLIEQDTFLTDLSLMIRAVVTTKRPSASAMVTSFRVGTISL